MSGGDQPSEDGPGTAGGPSGDAVTEGAARVGGALGRMFRDAKRIAEEQRPAAEDALHTAGDAVRHASERVRPELARLAEQVRAAADAATPRIERAIGDARQYLVAHEDEIARGARRAAQEVARGAAPAAMRPAVDSFVAAMQTERTRATAPRPGEPPSDAPGSDAAAGPGTTSDAAPSQDDSSRN